MHFVLISCLNLTLRYHFVCPQLPSSDFVFPLLNYFHSTEQSQAAPEIDLLQSRAEMHPLASKLWWLQYTFNDPLILHKQVCVAILNSCLCKKPEKDMYRSSYIQWRPNISFFFFL